MKHNKALLGCAGVHYVCAELSRQGIIALPTIRNTAGIDILASSADGSHHVAVQVKTGSTGYVWRLSASGRIFEHAVYVLVGLVDGKPPTFHILPGAVMAELAQQEHDRWLTTHDDDPVRTLTRPPSEYLDRWDLLGLEGGEP